MRFLRKLLFSSALFVVGAGFANAQQIEPASLFHKNRPVIVPAQPYCPTPSITPVTPVEPGKTPEPPVQPPVQQPEQPPVQQPEQAPDFSAFTQPSPGGTAGLTSGGSERQMIGDQGGFTATRIVFVPQTVTTTVTSNLVDPTSLTPLAVPPVTTTTTKLVPVAVVDPIASRAGSGFKIADNASPRPVDRVFVTYNYFHNLQGSGGFTPGGTQTVTSVVDTPTAIGTQTAVSTIPGTAISGRSLNLHRELFGFEKTFLNGDASVELRLPFYQSAGDQGIGTSDFGDLSVGLKYAFINDRTTGNVFSGGLLITAPTGPGIQTARGTIDSWLLQPWVGYIYNTGGGIYLHAFHSIVVPTESEDVTVLFNDLGVGWNMYQAAPGMGGMLTSVTPTLEVHVTTPLNNRGDNELISVSDIVSFTGGMHFGFGQKCLLTIGVNVPITGPQPYDVEGIAQFNMRF